MTRSQQIAALSAIGSRLAKGKGTFAGNVRLGAAALAAARRHPAKRATAPLKRAPLPHGFDLAGRQSAAKNRARYYAPMHRSEEDARGVAPAPVLKAASDITGIDVGEHLAELQHVADSILNVAGSIFGVDVSPGFSGGVTAQEAQFIYAPGNRTGAGILEQQARLADVEGTRGTKQVFVNGEYIEVGGRGRGGPGFRDLAAALEP